MHVRCAKRFFLAELHSLPGPTLGWTNAMGVLAKVNNLGDSDGVRVGVGPTPLPIMPTALTRSALVTARARERTINCFHMWEMGIGRGEGAGCGAMKGMS